MVCYSKENAGNSDNNIGGMENESICYAKSIAPRSARPLPIGVKRFLERQFRFSFTSTTIDNPDTIMPPFIAHFAG